MNNGTDQPTSLVISYVSLRKALGWLGLLLPFILSLGALWFFDTGLRETVSDYYHTGMRDVFVAILFAIGVFLYCYKGYERKDDWAGNLAGLAAMCVAFFPTKPDLEPTPRDELIGVIHLVSAAVFFITIAYISLFLFTLTDKTKAPTKRKLLRNQVYRLCGLTILASIALVAAYKMWIDPTLSGLKPVFWLEAIAVMAFGVSWLVKGEALLGDQT